MNTNTSVEQVKFADLHVPIANKKLNFEGEDIYYKLTHNESRPVKIESAPIYFNGVDGKLYDTKRFTAGFRNEKLTAIVSRKYQFVANEVGYRLIKESGFKPTATHFSKSGNAMFVEVFDEKPIHTFNTDGNGDSVKVGVLVRNSVDGTTSFGGDIFTYRGRCGNGAIFGKKALGSFSVKHVGDYQRLISVFRQYLERAFRLSQQVRVHYQKAAEINVNLELAEALVKTQIPQKFLPDFISVQKDGQVILEDKTKNVWEAFNLVTEKAWHLESLGIQSKSTYTSRANSWLFNATAPLVVA